MGNFANDILKKDRWLKYSEIIVNILKYGFSIKRKGIKQFIKVPINPKEII